MSSEKGIMGQMLKASSLVLVVKMLGLAAGYIFFWMMGNFLGAAETGRFSLFFTLLFILSIPAKLGMDTALVRWMSPIDNLPGKQRGLYIRSLGICILCSSILAVLVFLLAPVFVSLFKGSLSLQDLKFLALLIPPFAIIHLNFETLRAKKDTIGFSLFQNVFRFAFAILFLAIPLWILLNDADPVRAYGQAVLVSFVLSFVWVGIRLGNGSVIKPDISTSAFMGTALPMMLSASVFYILSWTDVLMLGNMRSDAEVGIYNTAFKLATLANFPIMAVSAYAAPKFSEWLGKDENRVFKQLVKQSSKLSMAGSLPIILVLVLFPKTLLGIFGEEFRVAELLIYILMLGQIINSATGLGGDILQMTGHHKLFSRIILLAAIVNITLNALLIPTYGYHGAALASIISLAGWKLTCAWFIRRKYGLSVIYLPLLSK